MRDDKKKTITTPNAMIECDELVSNKRKTVMNHSFDCERIYRASERKKKRHKSSYYFVYVNITVNIHAIILYDVLLSMMMMMMATQKQYYICACALLILR